MISASQIHTARGRPASDNSRSFERRLASALRQRADGEPAALMYLEVAGAWDVRDACGRDAEKVLAETVAESLADHVNSPMTCAADGRCGFSVLFEGTSLERALVQARSLKRDVDRLRFQWCGRPFRVSAFAGLVELGSEPLRARYWLGSAREACAAARELGGSGVLQVRLNDHAWSDIARKREWVQHLSEIIG